MSRFRFRSLLVVLALILAALAGCASGPAGSSKEDVQTSSDQTEIQKRASLRLQLAIGYFEQHQWKTALDEVKKALAIDPRYADAYSVRGLIYMEMGESGLAEDNFLYALKLSPKNPDFSNNYGWFLCQNGREKESIPYFNDAIDNPSYQSQTKALNNAGMCSLKMKQGNEALRYFSRAFQFDPSHPLTSAYLAKIYLGQGDAARARFYLGRLSKADVMPPNVLWVAINVARKLGDRDSEMSLVSRLRHNYPKSSEYAAYQREAFDD